MKNYLRLLALATVHLCLPIHASADNSTAKHFDDYSVFYTVFNSTFIPENVAASYQVKRSKYESILNIAVLPKGETYGGIPASLSGTVTNLMQQQKKLDFKQIQEGEIVYFLAPVRINGEEVVHFDVQIVPENSKTPLNVKFTKTLYSDNL